MSTQGPPQANKETRFDKVKNELVDTEKTYLKGLQKIMNAREEIKQQIAKEEKLSDEQKADVIAMLHYVDTIEDFNIKMNKKFEDLLKTDKPDKFNAICNEIATLNKEGAKYYSKYSKLYENYNTMKFSENTILGELDSVDLTKPKNALIFPVQRYPRYVLLFKDMEKFVPDEVVDAIGNLRHSFEITGIRINLGVKQSEISSLKHEYETIIHKHSNTKFEKAKFNKAPMINFKDLGHKISFLELYEEYYKLREQLQKNPNNEPLKKNIKDLEDLMPKKVKKDLIQAAHLGLKIANHTADINNEKSKILKLEEEHKNKSTAHIVNEVKHELETQESPLQPSKGVLPPEKLRPQRPIGVQSPLQQRHKQYERLRRKDALELTAKASTLPTISLEEAFSKKPITDQLSKEEVEKLKREALDVINEVQALPQKLKSNLRLLPPDTIDEFKNRMNYETINITNFNKIGGAKPKFKNKPKTLFVLQDNTIDMKNDRNNLANRIVHGGMANKKYMGATRLGDDPYDKTSAIYDVYTVGIPTVAKSENPKNPPPILTKDHIDLGFSNLYMELASGRYENICVPTWKDKKTGEALPAFMGGGSAKEMSDELKTHMLSRFKELEKFCETKRFIDIPEKFINHFAFGLPNHLQDDFYQEIKSAKVADHINRQSQDAANLQKKSGFPMNNVQYQHQLEKAAQKKEVSSVKIDATPSKQKRKWFK